MITALITGIGGTNSIAILKALRTAGISHRAIGTDTKLLNAGSFLADAAYTIPPVNNEKAYLAAIEKIITAESVKIIFATTEVEIVNLAHVKKYLEEKYDLVVMVPETDILDICQDKYRTQEFLKKNDFVYIPTILTDDTDAMNDFIRAQGFPVIRKPIRGYGSRGIDILYDELALARLEPSDEYVLQKYIDTDTDSEFNEYTAEVFVNKNGRIAGGIIIQRTLIRGESNNGKVIKDEVTMKYLEEVATKLGIKGPCNFQYRIRDGKAYIFEINARYSGTSAVRAHYGFNNVSLAIRSFVQNDHHIVKPDEISEGYFIRYWEEAYITPEAYNKLAESGHIDNV